MFWKQDVAAQLNERLKILVLKEQLLSEILRTLIEIYVNKWRVLLPCNYEFVMCWR